MTARPDWTLPEAVAYLRRRFDDWCDIPTAPGVDVDTVPGYGTGPRVDAYALRTVLDAVEEPAARAVTVPPTEVVPCHCGSRFCPGWRVKAVTR